MKRFARILLVVLTLLLPLLTVGCGSRDQKPQMMASVSFMVYEAETYTPARIDLVYEDGRWVIDNFHNLRYMTDFRESMWDFLRNDNLM